MKEGKFDGEGLFYKKKENKTYKSKFENGKCREIMSTFEGEIQKNDISNQIELYIIYYKLPCLVT